MYNMSTLNYKRHLNVLFNPSVALPEILSREMIRTVRGGTEVLRDTRVKYLPKEPGESPDSYRRRLLRSFLTNYVDRTAKNLASKPFTRPIVVKSEAHQELADEYVKAVDGKGTSLTGLCSTTFEDALWNGSSFIAMDAAVDGGRPYAYGVNSSPEELNALANARTMGDLSQEDYLQELKRRGLLRNDFSLADNTDRLSTELVV